MDQIQLGSASGPKRTPLGRASARRHLPGVRARRHCRARVNAPRNRLAESLSPRGPHPGALLSLLQFLSPPRPHHESRCPALASSSIFRSQRQFRCSSNQRDSSPNSRGASLAMAFSISTTELTAGIYTRSRRSPQVRSPKGSDE